MRTNSLFLQPVSSNDGDLYYCHWQSIFAAFNELVEEIKKLGISNDIEIMNMDDFSDIHEIPMNDFIIFRHFNMDINEGVIDVSFNVGVSTYSDGNNHRLSKLISYIYGRYMPGKAQNILDKDGLVKGTITFTDGTLINYMSKSEMRSTQFITVTALSTARPSSRQD